MRLTRKKQTIFSSAALCSPDTVRWNSNLEKYDNTDGVEQVRMEMAKNQVTVTGTMDMKALPKKLRKKLRRPVVPPNNNNDKNKQQDRKDKDGKQGDGKDNKAGGKDAVEKTSVVEVELRKAAFFDQQAIGGGWQGLVAYINLGCYYVFGLSLGYFLGYKFN